MSRTLACFSSLAVGQHAESTRTVTVEDIDAFAAVTGDDNPAHLDEAYAAQTTFKGRIAHGMLLAGFISKVLGTQLPGEGAIYIEQTLQFKRPVRPGDEVLIRVEVQAIFPNKKRVQLSTQCFVGGKIVVDGTAVLQVPAPQPAAQEAAPV